VHTLRRALRRTAGSAACAGLLLGLLAGAPPAQAGPAERKAELDRIIAGLEHDLEGTSAELTRAHATLEQTRSRLPAAQEALAAAESELAAARRKDAELAARLAAAEQVQTQAEEALREGEEDLAASETALGRIAVETYRSAGVSPGLSIALNAESPEDFADRMAAIDTAFRTQRGTAARLEERQALRVHQEERLAAVRDEVDRLRDEAAAALEAADAARAAAAAAKAEIDALVAQQAQAARVVEQRRAEEMTRLDAERAEREQVEAELRRIADAERRERERQQREATERARQEAAERSAAARSAPRPGPRDDGAAEAAPRPPSRSGGLSRPISAPITSRYGWRIHPIYGTRRMHAGTDYGAACGTPVRAAAGGSVVRAGSAGGYGNQIVLSHGVIGGRSLGSSYNHLSRYAVRGGRVDAGQVIGYVGTTGASTGCHLHFEVYVNGSHVDPQSLL
jgi:murein DD-endopeptidase MepM/ murein hydrolase activator NlpD